MKDAALAAWARQPFALVHGEDGDGRKAAVAAWKAVHVDPEWSDWSLTVCGEGCPWAEIQNALQEAPPMGAAARVVLAPAADNLFAKPKELPASLKGWLDKPPADLRLLLVAWGTLSAAPGKALGAKPWTDWAKAGRILKTGVLEAEELDAFLAAEAKRLGLELGPRPKELLVQRLGGHPGLLRRALEVLDLLCEDRKAGEAQVDQVTFRLADQKAFAWSSAWQRGDTAGALAALRLALEDGDEPLMLLGQARREVDRALKFADAEARGLQGAQLTGALGLSPRQAFLLDGYRSVAAKLKGEGLKALLAKVNQCERDLKGEALSRSETPLLDLSLGLARAWSR
ncbi:MAG TPA: DNA polymerase III subunit delta [Holophagaceae bacterium]|nr:DNA polymerase III subunit delta [Holophagaceae bacterium]